MVEDRTTRELTPLVEVVGPPTSLHGRLILQTEAGAIFEEDGRVVFKMPTASGRPVRILVDPDVDLYELIVGTDQSLLDRCFEVHVPGMFGGDLPRPLQGATRVVPPDGTTVPVFEGQRLAIEVPAGTEQVPSTISEVHVMLTDSEAIPTVWPRTEVPIVAIVPISGPESADVLPQLMHGMGTGRCPVRELRLRINPRVFQVKDRRAPFMSEVVEAVAAGVGCSTTQLAREMALRNRLLGRGIRRHMLPDPFFTTWIFRGHRSRGLVPATDHFPVPRRASRQEILRGTPESEHERLLAYLSLLEASASRLDALQERKRFAVSVHFLPNPDLPIFPNHGGIGRWDWRQLQSLGAK